MSLVALDLPHSVEKPSGVCDHSGPDNAVQPAPATDRAEDHRTCSVIVESQPQPRSATHRSPLNNPVLPHSADQRHHFQPSSTVRQRMRHRTQITVANPLKKYRSRFHAASHSKSQSHDRLIRSRRTTKCVLQLENERSVILLSKTSDSSGEVGIAGGNSAVLSCNVSKRDFVAAGYLCCGHPLVIASHEQVDGQRGGNRFR